MKGNYSNKKPSGSGERDEAPKLENGKDYNEAGSDNVDKVDSVDVRQDEHSMPTKGKENSVIRNYRGGRLNQQRYFDGNGNPYLDIDYTDHGNSAMHPNVPHEHKIERRNGRIFRKKEGR